MDRRHADELPDHHWRLSKFLPFAVSLYFCMRLLGLPGIVISINPSLRAGNK
jgi:hypothetical protein